MSIIVSGLLLAGVTSFGLAQDSTPFTVSGYILDSDGKGIAGATIIFNVPKIVPSVYSNYSGYYEVSTPAGTYHVNVWPPFDSNYLSYDEPAFAVQSDVTKNITLATGYKISGYITGTLGAPVNKTVVSLDSFFCGWYSDYSGYYFVTVPAGTYNLFAKPAQGPQDVTDFYTYAEYNVVVNGDLEKDFTVKTHTEISGYVLDEEGNGLADANVIFGVPEIVPGVFTDYSGYYTVYVPRGTYHVNVWPPFDSNYISFDQPEFTVGTRDFTKNITLSSGYKLSGYLTDSSGAPIRGAFASLDQFHCGWYSDTSGYYFVTAPAGTYTLTIQSKTGQFFPIYTENNFALNGDNTKNIILTGANIPFSDNFDDGVADGWTQHDGSWSVINGEYFVSVGVIEDGITTVNGLDLTDCTISTKLRFTDPIGFRSGIIFRFIDSTHYYSIELGNEYDTLDMIKYTPEDPNYGETFAQIRDTNFQKDVDYQLKIIVSGNLFRCFINGEEALTGTDNSYTHGGAGLRARRADVCFDNFRIENATTSPSPKPTPSPVPTPNPSFQSYSDDFSADSGAWQYVGSAYRDQTNEYLVLTESVYETAGVAWFNAPIQHSFTASFRYKTFGGSKGDGFTLFFFKQTYSSLGTGGSLGFTNSDHKIVPGYGIEFDGWKNWLSDFQQFDGEINPPDGDPSSSHIALIEGHVGNHLAYVNDDRIGDNVWHQVFVEVQESSIRVFVDQELILEWSGLLNRTYDGFGFSGADGGVGTNWHIIDDFSISTEIVKPPPSFLPYR